MWLGVIGLALVSVLLYDVFHKRRAILRRLGPAPRWSEELPTPRMTPLYIGVLWSSFSPWLLLK